MPQPEPFVGGFTPHPHRTHQHTPDLSHLRLDDGPPPPVPPKDESYQHSVSISSSSPPSAGIAWSQSSHDEPIVPEHYAHATQKLAHMSPVQRSQHLRVAGMSPMLQFMVGPLLKYDTVDGNGIWHGAAMIVSEW